jgi:hypothetical protein
MAGRPRSIYERLTNPTIPPPDQVEKRHQVIEGESLLSVANDEYGLQEYNSNRWRDIGLHNGVENPFAFDEEFRRQFIRIPPIPLPEFID